MKFIPSENLTESQIDTGLKLIVKDGLMAEAMATLTGGAFLVSFALNLGASNFQIGLISAMPMLTNLFQLVAIYLIFLWGNRRKLSVVSSFLGRLPLLFISIIPLIFDSSTGLTFLLCLLTLHYISGAINGCSWNSWMKDLVPENRLGTYFSNRSRLIQMLNVVLSLTCAISLDTIKSHFPQFEMSAYSVMFFLGGLAGLYGVYIISKVGEPKMISINTNFIRLFKNPFKDFNFRNLLVFNAFWSFGINLAAPFFSVYLLKMLHYPLSYVVGFTILSQLANILFIRIWGKYSDLYSNKTILRICGPIYLCCILAFTFTTLPEKHAFTFPLLIFIYSMIGVSSSGINLAISNMGIKLAPQKSDAVVYLTARGMVNAFFAGIAPVIGGYFVDFLSKSEFEWTIPGGEYIFHTLNLNQWDFFFLLACIIGFIALKCLSNVKERGEVANKVVLKEIKEEFKTAPINWKVYKKFRKTKVCETNSYLISDHHQEKMPLRKKYN